MRLQTREAPIWRLVEKAAQELTKAGRTPFTRGDLITIVQRTRPGCGADSINPIIQGVTDNLRGGAPGAIDMEILHSVGRGKFVLKQDATRTITPAKEERESVLLPRSADRGSAAEKWNPKLRLGLYDFHRVCQIEPRRTADGSVQEFKPQTAYKNDGGLALNRYGAGPFCRFSIPSNLQFSGCYAILVNSEVRYVGECGNLSARYNMGYGLISPRNCFKNGQETNCRINNLLLQAAKGNSEIALWFLPTEDYKIAERELLQELVPPWNR